MKRAAAIGVLTWVACSAIYFLVLRGRVGAAIPVAIVVGLFMATAIGTLRIAVASWSDARKLLASAARPPEDGEEVMLSGRIRVEGEALRSPFRKRPAAAYVYEISHTDTMGDDTSQVKDYSGLALARCVLDTPHGAIALHGMPLLEGFPRDAFDDLDEVQRMLARTRFAEMTGFRFTETIRELRELVGSEATAIRKDWRLTTHDVTEDSQIFEDVVPADAIACASGKYDAGRRALVPGANGAIRLIAGSAEEAADVLARKARSALVPAIVMFLVLNGIVFGLRAIAPAHAATAKRAKPGNVQTYLDAAYNDDLPTLQKMVSEGMPVDAHLDDGTTALFRVHRLATAEWLLAHGADVNAQTTKGQTPLMQQATAGNAEIVRLLISRGARLDDVDREWKMSALAQALHAERMEVVQILRDAGAKDETVTEATGTPLAEGDPPALVAAAWLEAVFAEDRAKLGELWGGEGDLGTIDFKIWKGARPHPAHLLRGFRNDDKATLWLRGPNPGGISVTWRYDLAFVAGTWKVRSEAWETRFDGVADQ